ncbi:transcription termination factor rho family protein [Lusitaniella coriacea LEGE 07157]|uniref:Transcription termination factor rho family protein n=1 Tax=Lusitaniella coriacea LEGE 07157 TaxID=945747 RepID=A0A8J7J5E9_9CYAN|nr:Rho termination factor N-terminal domain-containing protein [Lusitaniella coriacea]MBE9117979.1 transcription termination factor rho family protein [Lusitaniella coriacea LEGE 07157]
MKQEIGKLLHIYLDEIITEDPIETHEFLIDGAAKAINEAGGRNWIPLIVRQTEAEEFKVVANGFIFAAAEEAGIEKVWCIIADDSEKTQHSAKILAQEKTPSINLAKASRDEIKMAIDYLTRRSVNPLKGVKTATATERIDSAPRKYWKESLMDVTKLKCGITRGAKLKIFKEVFYTTPEPLPDVITDVALLNTFTTSDLKKMAKKRGFSGYSKFKKSDLVKLLSTNES